jgi:lipopolysaccharide biosynthesis glycosyltransferase
MVVNSSLAKLFNTDLTDFLIAGALDINKKMVRKNPTYINAGMIVFNLKNIRAENIEEKFQKWTIENFDKIKTGDQTIINEVCRGKIKIVDGEWNIQSSNFTNRSSFTVRPKVIHFVAKNKPWSGKSFSYHKNEYFKYLQLTPWKLTDKELKRALKSTIWAYLKYRPLFFLRPSYYGALLKTYVEPIFEPKSPIVKSNTFIVWEPCSKSHSEVVPGYVKYLLDLGYNVSVLVHPDRLKEGLFSKFDDKRVFLNKMSKKQIKNYFKTSDLSDVEGVLVTTVGKICDEIHFEQAYNAFNPNADKSKLLFVSHEAVHAVDNGSWREENITLRNLDYKNAKSVVVNPHYFGDIKITPKNDITNFIMIGAIKPYKKNDNTIIEAVKELDEKGISNFKITVVGKGHIKNIPQNIRKYFDMKGRLPFNKMYKEIEQSDFLLTAYDENNPMHVRYNTTGTSGNFQLVYGFLKPVVITRDFAPINEFDGLNSIIYESPENYAKAMEQAILLTKEDYANMQNRLKNTVDGIYKTSKNNLKDLINGR